MSFRYAVTAIATCCALFTILGCSSDKNSSDGSASGATRVLVLLADARLLAIDPASARIAAEAELGDPVGAFGAGRFMAAARDGRTVFALVGGDRGGIAVVDAGNLRVRARHRLPPGLVARGLAVGPVSGQIYVFANRAGEATTRFGEREQEVVVARMRADTGAVVTTSLVRPARGREWRIYRGAVSDDERRVVISYHGADVDGADWLDVNKSRLIPCAAVATRHACLRPVHGNLEPHRDNVLAARGAPPSMVQLDGRGRVTGSWNTRLAGNHLMEFAVDSRRDRAVAVGSCLYTGGLSDVELNSGHVRVLVGAQPGGLRDPDDFSSTVCGERIAIGSRSTLVILKGAGPDPRAGGDGAVLLVASTNGRIAHSIGTPAVPVDVLVVPTS
jgi:hypothetical protein